MVNSCRRQEEYSFSPFRMKRVLPTIKSHRFKWPTARSGHRCVANDFDLYCFGGYNPQLCPTAEEDWSETCPLFRQLWKFNFATRCWKKLSMHGAVPTKLASHSAVLKDNILMVYGGTGVPFGDSNSNTLYTCDLKTCVWTEVKTSGIPPMEQYGQAVTLNNNHLYVVGGTTGFEYTIDVYSLNLTTKKWTEFYPRCAELPNERYRHEIAMHGDKIFVFGGGTSTQSFSFKYVFCFNITSHKWSKIHTQPDLSVCPSNLRKADGYPLRRRCHSLVQMGDDIYICGGYNGLVIRSDVWRFSLVSYEWRRITNRVPLPTYFHSAALTPKGCMYVYGGINNVETNQRSSDVFCMWLTVPKLKDICWEAAVHYFGDWIRSSSESSLLREGIPKEYVDSVDLQADCG